MEIGNRLKNARVEIGLTQEKVAEEIGVSRQTVSNWENGKFYPDIVSVIKLSDLYSVSLDELLKEDKNMLRHLKESTDTVASRDKLTRFILQLCYWGLWVLGVMIWWAFAASNLNVDLMHPNPTKYNLLVSLLLSGGHLFLFPAVIAAIMGIMGAAKDFDRRRWLYVPITGAMFVIYRLVTAELLSYLQEMKCSLEFAGEKASGNMLVHYFTGKGYVYINNGTTDEWHIMLLIGLGCSALGMGVGILIRKFKIVRREASAE